MKTKFTSRLGPEMEEFLTFKRGLGRRYTRAEYRLRSFDRLVKQSEAEDEAVRFEQLISRWLSRDKGRKATAIRADFSVIRQFCLYRRRRDATAFVPDGELAPPSRQEKFLPHIMTPSDVRFLLEQTKTIRPPPFRRLTYRTLLLVLYCTGLRPGEALRLRLCDVDLRAKTLFIENSKRKSRSIAFRDDLARQLRRYLKERMAIRPAVPGAPFFVQPTGRGYPTQTASQVIRTLFRRIGWKPPRGRVGPRPYDARHSFAVNRLTSWYQEGVDINAKLPLLSAYMGHDDIVGTEVYLQATPQLLEIASRRFATRFGQ
jgi:integrase